MKRMVYDPKTRENQELELIINPNLITVGDKKEWEQTKSFFDEYEKLIDEDDYEDEEFPEIEFHGEESIKVQMNSYKPHTIWLYAKYFIII